jgi:nitrate reductase NapAB chaperone NapD
MEVQRPAGGGSSWHQAAAVAEVAVPRRSSAHADEAAAPDWWGFAGADSMKQQQRPATGSFTAPSQLLASAAWAGWGGSQHQQQPRQQQPPPASAVAALSAIHAEVQHLRVVLDSLLAMETVAVPGSSPEAKIQLLLRAHQHTMAEALSAQQALERVVQRSAASSPLPAVHPDLVGARASLDAGFGGAYFTCYGEPRRPLEERSSRAEALDDDEEEDGGSSSAATLLQHFGHFAVI